LLKQWIFLIRALNSFLIETRPNKELTCYRKSDLTKEQYDKINPGNVYRIAMYTATSTDEEFVKKWYRNSGKYYFKFNVPKDSYNACCLTPYSYHSVENEVLMPPYSTILIKEKTDDGYIIADIVDNKDYPTSLPTIIV